MRTLEEVLELLEFALDRQTLEEYIRRTWIRPVRKREVLYFEDIDIARIRLIWQLRHDLLVDEEAMDVVLPLLDQVYGLRRRIRALTEAIERQPREVQAEIFSLLTEMQQQDKEN